MANDEEPQGKPRKGRETDVEAIHRQLLRESREPEEGAERVPRWLWVLAVLAIFWGGYYLGRFGGTFSTDTHISLREAPGDPVPTGDALPEVPPEEIDGQAVFARHCATCHQADGQGIPGTFPPLVGSEHVVGDPGILVRILLHGMQGPVVVAGVEYDGVMPGWQAQLSVHEIAAVATYIRQMDTNEAPPVDADAVTSVQQETETRTEPWTVEELERSEASDETE